MGAKFYTSALLPAGGRCCSRGNENKCAGVLLPAGGNCGSQIQETSAKGCCCQQAAAAAKEQVPAAARVAWASMPPLAPQISVFLLLKLWVAMCLFKGFLKAWQSSWGCWLMASLAEL